MRRRARYKAVGLGTVLFLWLVPRPAPASEVSGGVGVGGLVAGTLPRFAVSPHVAAAWRTDGGLGLVLRDMLSLLPHPRGLGVYDQAAADLGYAHGSLDFGLGPSIVGYSILACRPDACRRVEGLSPGIHAQVSWYLGGALGLSIWAGVDWHLGDSTILSGQVSALVVAGPVLRWRSK